MKIWLLLFSLACILLTSCSSMSSFQSPKVLLQEETEFGVGGSFVFGNNEPPRLINLEAYKRFGLGKNWETGLKLFGLPGLSGGLMAEVKYQLLDDPIHVSADLGSSVSYAFDSSFYDIYPMLIAGNEKIYGGYRGILRNEINDYSDSSFKYYLHGFFLGYKYGKQPYLRPEVFFYTNDFQDGFFIAGLGLQLW
jgi:hypothetical protein